MKPNGRREAVGGGGARREAGIQLLGLTFTRRELLDFALAWVALSVAFAAFLTGPQSPAVLFTNVDVLTSIVAISAATCGVGFMLHELAHKVVAVRYGQVAHFVADYGMLFIAVMSGFAGFLFAAPGAVHHSGRITTRENGLIALAGPVTNLVLVFLFSALFVVGGSGPELLARVGQVGVTINAFLAAFNMIPYGPLDGRSVYRWNPVAWLVVFVLGAGTTLALLVGVPGIGIGLGF